MGAVLLLCLSLARLGGDVDAVEKAQLTVARVDALRVPDFCRATGEEHELPDDLRVRELKVPDELTTAR